MNTTRKVWSPSFFPVLLTYFINNFGQAIVYPIFTPLILHPKLGFLPLNTPFLNRTLYLGLLIASFSLAQLFSAPLLGSFADTKGRKKVFFFTLTGGIIGYLLTGLGVHLHHLPLLWIGRVCAGFFAGNLTICLAAVADITHTKEERAKNFGWIGTLGGLSFVCAILIGSSLSNPSLSSFFHPEIPFYITSLLSAVTLLLVMGFYKETRHGRPHNRIDFFNNLRTIGHACVSSNLRPLYFTYFLFILSWGTSLQFLSTYLIHDFKVDQNMITYAFVGIGITWSFANFILNPLLSKVFKSLTTFSLGLALLAIALFLTLIPHQPLFLFLIHFFIASLCAGLCWTNGLATLSIKATSSTQGSILGVNQSLIAMGFIAGPLIGGLLAGIDIHDLYVFTATCSLVAASLLFNHTFGIRKT